MWVNLKLIIKKKIQTKKEMYMCSHFRIYRE